MTSGRLVVCPTPIGNLGDITVRALEELGAADAIACEDTRRTRVLLERHGITAKLIAVHDRNERSAARAIVERLRKGETVVFVSDAGMPVISDPGFVLVRACLAAELEVDVLPGASALTTAIVASNLPADRFSFEGFLPRRSGELERLFKRTNGCFVAFESPRRLAASLSVLAAIEPLREVAVCRELTKLHSEVVRGSAAKLAEQFAAEPPRGEITVVFGPVESGKVDGAAGLEQLQALIKAGAKPRPAAKAVAALTGGSANALYAAAEAARSGDAAAD